MGASAELGAADRQGEEVGGQTASAGWTISAEPLALTGGSGVWRRLYAVWYSEFCAAAVGQIGHAGLPLGAGISTQSSYFG